ncbi:MAG TPA: CHRD domain-containing protein [Thermoanaerobaculia bacterium]|nr:CHRD domain-containing protein [Thermoanaerobaculia bacterium]
MQRSLPLAVLLTLLVATGSAFAQEPLHLSAILFGREEVPALSNFGRGTFESELSADLSTLTYELEYSGLGSPVQQAHIHIAQRGVNGGIMVFLCSNLGNGPAGTQPCPDSGTISGTIHGEDIIGPTSQGLEVGNFFEFQRALRQGVTYINVHTVLHTGGEIRGQVHVP